MAPTVKTYGQGRTCARLTCKTTLSRYNNGTLCSIHAEQLGDQQRPERA